MKRIPMSLLACGLALSFSATALAGAPTSQFGYNGWAYRNETSCTQGSTCPEVGTCEQNCTQCESNDDCCTCPICTVTSKPTAAPTPVVTACPTPTQAPQPTNQAPATAAPTATAQPTLAPKPTATAAPTKQPTPTSTPDYTTNSPTVQEQNAWNLLNSDRVKNGLAPLTLDAELSRLARLKSTDMKENHYFSHTSPTYGSAADLLNANGYSFAGVGENIAHHSTIDKAQAAFMSSEGHRRNILGSQWTKVGVGVCVDDHGFVYVTQLFVR